MNHHQARLIRLLDWIGETGDRDGSFIAVRGFYGGDGSQAATAREDLRQLQAHGYIHASIPMGGMDSYQALIQGLGYAEVARRRSRREDRVAREWALRSGLVRWLYAENALPGTNRQVDWHEFPSREQALFEGYPFDIDEVEVEAAWLGRNQLLDGVYVNEAQWPVNAFLTDQGVECAQEFNGDVRAYRDAMRQPQQPQASVSVSIGGSVSGPLNVAGRDVNVTQSAEGIALAIRGIAEIVDRLGYAGDESQEFRQTAHEAAASTESGRPDPTSLQRFAAWFTGRALGAGDAAVGAALSTAANGAVQNAEHLLRTIT